MRAGMLRSSVELQGLVNATDEIGQPSTSWLTTATVYADIRHLSGLSAIKAGTDISVNRVSIRLRFRAVTPAMRVVHNGVVFAIEAVLPDPKKAFVDLVCQAVT